MAELNLSYEMIQTPQSVLVLMNSSLNLFVEKGHYITLLIVIRILLKLHLDVTFLLIWIIETRSPASIQIHLSNVTYLTKVSKTVSTIFLRNSWLNILLLLSADF